MPSELGKEIGKNFKDKELKDKTVMDKDKTKEFAAGLTGKNDNTNKNNKK